MSAPVNVVMPGNDVAAGLDAWVALVVASMALLPAGVDVRAAGGRLAGAGSGVDVPAGRVGDVVGDIAFHAGSAWLVGVAGMTGLASAAGIASQGGMALAGGAAVAVGAAVGGALVRTCEFTGCAAEATVDATGTPNVGAAEGASIPDPAGLAGDERLAFLLPMAVAASVPDGAADRAAEANAELPGRDGETGAGAAAAGNVPVVPAEAAAGGRVVETVKSVLPGVPAGVAQAAGTFAPMAPVDGVAAAAGVERVVLVGPVAIVEGTAVSYAKVWAGVAPLDASVAGRAVALAAPGA
ncbi:hypothetical protein [Burkholderia plantarii]|uniref:hypothetical protein n=1 Tax=Burkholderia plantarii TaxID=41899 RepID=UPI003F4A4D40